MDADVDTDWCSYVLYITLHSVICSSGYGCVYGCGPVYFGPNTYRSADQLMGGLFGEFSTLNLHNFLTILHIFDINGSNNRCPFVCFVAKSVWTTNFRNIFKKFLFVSDWQKSQYKLMGSDQTINYYLLQNYYYYYNDL